MPGGDGAGLQPVIQRSLHDGEVTQGVDVLLYGDGQFPVLGAHATVGRAAVGDQTLVGFRRLVAQALDAESNLLDLILQVPPELECYVYGIVRHLFQS